MGTDFKVRLWQGLKEASIHIDCDYATRRSHLRTEPLRDGTAAGTNLKALPAAGDAERPDATESPRVKGLLKKRQALARFMPGIIESISAHACLLRFLHQPALLKSPSFERSAKKRAVGT